MNKDESLLKKCYSVQFTVRNDITSLKAGILEYIVDTTVKFNNKLIIKFRHGNNELFPSSRLSVNKTDSSKILMNNNFTGKCWICYDKYLFLLNSRTIKGLFMSSVLMSFPVTTEFAQQYDA